MLDYLFDLHRIPVYKYKAPTVMSPISLGEGISGIGLLWQADMQIHDYNV